jgi:hypothetical protein
MSFRELCATELNGAAGPYDSFLYLKSQEDLAILHEEAEKKKQRTGFASTMYITEMSTLSPLS